MNQWVDISGKIIKQSANLSSTLMPSNEIPSNPNPLKLMKWYRDEIEWLETQINYVESLTGINSSCKKGCNGCCKQLIAITTPEILIIKAYLDQVDRKVKTELAERVKKTCKDIENSIGEQRFLPSSIISEELQDKYREAYYNLDLMCPLVTDEGDCLVYPVRPTNCWTYRYFGDPKDCYEQVFPSHSINFSDWEQKLLIRLFEAKKPGREGLRLLPFALKEIL